MYACGFHGTTRGAADGIQTEGFRLSQKRYDWLGDGVYFFQDSAARARSWAEERYGTDWVVIEVEIDLEGCMDLLDPAWFEVLNDAHDGVVAQHRLAGLRLPRQQDLAHGMDRAVINYAVGVLFERGVEIRSVRAVFQEGRPAYPGSALYDLAHIQIAVRDVSAITAVGVSGAEES